MNIFWEESEGVLKMTVREVEKTVRFMWQQLVDAAKKDRAEESSWGHPAMDELLKAERASVYSYRLFGLNLELIDVEIEFGVGHCFRATISTEHGGSVSCDAPGFPHVSIAFPREIKTCMRNALLLWASRCMDATRKKLT